MKTFVNTLFICLLSIGIRSGAQVPVVSMTAMNYGYFGVENEVDIAVSQYNCSDLIISSDNGVITGKDCHYILKPDRVGQANISIKAKRKNAINDLGTFAIIIYKVPDPVINLTAFYFTDTISNKELLIKSPTLLCRLPGFRIEYTFKIIQYRLTIFRHDSICHQEKTDNNSFSNTFKLKLDGLMNGDVLLFDEIIAESKEGKRNLDSIKKVYYARTKD